MEQDETQVKLPIYNMRTELVASSIPIQLTSFPINQNLNVIDDVNVTLSGILNMKTSSAELPCLHVRSSRSRYPSYMSLGNFVCHRDAQNRNHKQL